MACVSPLALPACLPLSRSLGRKPAGSTWLSTAAMGPWLCCSSCSRELQELCTWAQAFFSVLRYLPLPRPLGWEARPPFPGSQQAPEKQRPLAVSRHSLARTWCSSLSNLLQEAGCKQQCPQAWRQPPPTLSSPTPTIDSHGAL